MKFEAAGRTRLRLQIRPQPLEIKIHLRHRLRVSAASFRRDTVVLNTPRFFMMYGRTSGACVSILTITTLTTTLSRPNNSRAASRLI
jgi:hypothetical protein